MSQIKGDNTHPKYKIIATDRVTDPSNEATPILASHQAVADAAKAKQLAKADPTHAKPPAPPNVGASSPNSTFMGSFLGDSDEQSVSSADTPPEKEKEVRFIECLKL